MSGHSEKLVWSIGNVLQNYIHVSNVENLNYNPFGHTETSVYSHSTLIMNTIGSHTVV